MKTRSQKANNEAKLHELNGDKFFYDELIRKV